MNDRQSDLRQFEGIRTITFDDCAQKVSLDRAIAKIPEDMFLLREIGGVLR